MPFINKKMLQNLKFWSVNKFQIWFYNVKNLPVGTHFYYFLKYRVRFPITTGFDVGANNGSIVLLFTQFFPSAKVVCFEPFSTTYKRLVSNTEHLRNVQTYRVALSDVAESRQVSVLPEDQSVANSLSNRKIEDVAFSGNEETIEVQTIDMFLEAHSEISTIDLLKIDTEGFDLKVLKGAENAMRQKRIRSIYTEVGLSLKNDYHIHLSKMIDFCESFDFVFIGLFAVDIRHSPWDRHFGNAFFIHKSMIDKVVL